MTELTPAAESPPIAPARSMMAPKAPAWADFSQPAGEAAYIGPDSVSWRVFKNPLSLFIGGVTAVILEFAEPGVRTGVWEHSTFRKDPLGRLQRTGLAAMITVYGAKSAADRMTATVRRMHDRVRGVTPAGKPYAANDPDLLNWVQATAGFGFLEAYHAYVRPLSRAEKDRFYAEGQATAPLYGATNPPASAAEIEEFFEAHRARLEPHPIVFEFLDIMRTAPVLPWPLKPLQRLLIRAAVEITPPWVRDILGLDARYGLPRWAPPLLRAVGRLADSIVLADAPPAQACRRLGLPADHLYRKAARETST